MIILFIEIIKPTHVHYLSLNHLSNTAFTFTANASSWCTSSSFTYTAPA